MPTYIVASIYTEFHNMLSCLWYAINQSINLFYGSRLFLSQWNHRRWPVSVSFWNFLQQNWSGFSRRVWPLPSGILLQVRFCVYYLYLLGS